MRIMTDTASMYDPSEGKRQGVTVIPACTIMDGTVYRDFLDMDSDTFLERIAAGSMPTTSQPAIGDVLEVYQESDEETLVLPLGDGLSGTYQSMEGARQLMDAPENIHVLDTRTLAGPQWYLVQKAMKLRELGMGIHRIKEELLRSIETSISFVIPQDFNFLKRSSRLTPVAAKLGALLKIVPILTQTPDRKRITLYAIKRAKKKAVSALIEHFRERGVNDKYLITISHAGVMEEAMAVLYQFREHFATSVIQLFTLPPALICHGGPGCILVQAIEM